MKKIIATIMFAVFITTPLASYADKVGFVNINLLFSKYDEMQGIQKKMGEKFGSKQQELEKLATSIKALGKEIKTNELLMTESKLEGSKKKLNNMLVEMRQKEMTFKGELQEAQNKEMGKFRKIIFEMVKKYAEDKAFDMIINDGVVFVSPRVDVTNDILQILSKSKFAEKTTKK
ncbi:hypothetical protein MNBD_GAMMA09-3887 [hydrothermal vent metagenome]|uniref:Outer membrane protein H n=1 Tax=hydrothermal vent metagenome TaxID=652676 RepID=A0A3B0XF46_9ZZZZ